MKYLLFLIPSLCLAQAFNYVSTNGSGGYAEKEVCEKTEQVECIRRPVLKDVPATLMSLKQIEVDDPTKPIIEETEPELVVVEPIEDKCPDGFNPREVVNKPDEVANRGIEVANEVVKACERKACEAPKEYDDEKQKCVHVVGYEKKLEKRFVIDPDKIAAKEAAEQAERDRVAACSTARTLLNDSAINEQSKAADVQEVVRRLLSFHRNCQ